MTLHSLVLSVKTTPINIRIVNRRRIVKRMSDGIILLPLIYAYICIYVCPTLLLLFFFYLTSLVSLTLHTDRAYEIHIYIFCLSLSLFHFFLLHTYVQVFTMMSLYMYYHSLTTAPLLHHAFVVQRREESKD